MHIIYRIIRSGEKNFGIPKLPLMVNLRNEKVVKFDSFVYRNKGRCRAHFADAHSEKYM